MDAELVELVLRGGDGGRFGLEVVGVIERVFFGEKENF